VNLKCNLNHRIKPLDLLATVITSRVEGYPVSASAKNFILGEQLSAAAVAIRPKDTQHSPLTGRLLPLKPYGYVFRGLAQCGIQNMR
jgi:hypothetical protein